MKIVCLDGYTSNPGDISWAPVEQFGELTVYDRTDPEDTAERCMDADIVITNKTILTREIMSALPKLKFITFLATGTNSVDLKAAADLGIVVSNAPDYSTVTVAQTTFALLLELCINVGVHSQIVKSGEWTRSKHFSFQNTLLFELYGKTLGIIGYGAIGHEVRKIAKAFGMNILIHSRTRKPDIEDSEWCSLEELLAKSDVVTIHCPLTESNAKMINKDTIALMKDGAFLINTARGGLLDEQAVADALNSEKLAGVAVDVLSQEPPVDPNPLITAKNCFITPHIAWATKDARTRLLQIQGDNIKAFLDGKPINKVN